MSLFKDSGGKLVIWQRPNIALTGWLLCKFLSAVMPQSTTKIGLERLSSAFIFTWAYLEIASGRNYFRRGLGGIVMIAILIGYFK